jgi:hypothetical protein
VLFFTIIIVISQFFPLEMYPATFYVSLVGTYFVSLLALAVLFLPKFWNIWKNLHKPWADDLHPSNRSQQRLSGGIGRPGGGGGGAGVLGRMPDDFRTAPTLVSRQAGAATTTAAAARMGMSMGVGIGDDDNNHLGQHLEVDPSATDSIVAPVTNLAAPTDVETKDKSSKHRRSFAIASMHLGGGGAAHTQLDGNPLGAWMNARIPRQGSDAAAVEEKCGTFMRTRQHSSGLEDVEDGGGGGISGSPGENEAMNENVDGGSADVAEGSQGRRSRIGQSSISVDTPREHNKHNHVEFAENSAGLEEGGIGGAPMEGQETDVDLREPLRTAVLAERTFGSSISGAQRMV